MVDIYLPREIGGIEGQPPAVPEDIKIAIGNNDAASPHILHSRKRTLPGGASTGKQGILVSRILCEHGIDQTSHIISDTSPLPNCRCIVNCDTHRNIKTRNVTASYDHVWSWLAVTFSSIILVARQICDPQAGESANERHFARHQDPRSSQYGSHPYQIPYREPVSPR